MGIYGDRILPRLIDRACGTADLMRQRACVAAGLSGTVVEIGFGSGLNMSAYPDSVTEVLAVEPAARSSWPRVSSSNASSPTSSRARSRGRG